MDQPPARSQSNSREISLEEIVIECQPDDAECLASDALSLAVLGLHDDGRSCQSLEWVSPTKWRQHTSIEWPSGALELTFIVRSEGLGELGRVQLAESEVASNTEFNSLLGNGQDTLSSPLSLKFQVVGGDEDAPSSSESDLPDEGTAIHFLEKAATLTSFFLVVGTDEIEVSTATLDVSAKFFHETFAASKNITDIERAMLAQQQSVQMTADGDPGIVDRLTNLGIMFRCLFSCTGDLADADQGIAAQEKAIELALGNDEHLSFRFHNLGISLQFRFEQSEDLADIRRAISAQRRAVELTSDGDEDLPSRLNNLGISLMHCFGHTGDLATIDEATAVHMRSVELAHDGDAEMATYLTNLGSAFQGRFSQTGDVSDIQHAIAAQQKAIQLTPDDHSNMATLINNLGVSFHRRFSHTGHLTDIEQAISAQRRAIDLAGDDSDDMPFWLMNLAATFSRRFERTGDLADVEEAISSQRRAIQLAPSDGPYTPSLLNNLGGSFAARFEHTGNLDDIREAISLQQRAVQLTPDDHWMMPSRLTNLGISLKSRFERTGDVSDIQEAISTQLRAVQLSLDGDVDLPSRLNNLGNCLLCRFERAGDLEDTQEAISSYRKAIQFTASGHSDLPAWFGNLGNALLRRFERTGVLAEINEAIDAHKRCIQLTPDDQSDMPSWLSNLAVALMYRCERNGDLADLEEAASVLQKSIQLTAGGHAALPIRLNNLAALFRQRFETNKNLADVDDAISAQQRAISVTPPHHGNLPLLLSGLGRCLRGRFDSTGDGADLKAAACQYQEAATSSVGSPIIRFKAAQLWAELSRKFDPPQSLHAFKTAVELICFVAGLDQTMQNRHEHLSEISSLSLAAAAAALSQGQVDKALEWLEQGRCLVWSQLNSLRTPLGDLRSQNPALAERISIVSRLLDNAGFRGTSSTIRAEATIEQKVSLQEEAKTHVNLAQEWEQLLATARDIPGFEHFLRPSPASSLLKHLPESGSIVLINVHEERCDALALTAGVSNPIHIPLPKLSLTKAQELRVRLQEKLISARVRMRGSDPVFESDETRGIRKVSGLVRNVIEEILAELWTLLGKPILDALGYLSSPSSSPERRIWWCATGPLAFLPIHAAGIYTGSGAVNSKVSDFVVSSYTPTVSALVERLQNTQKVEHGSVGLFMISQPNAPGLPRIPGTTNEIWAIERQITDREVRTLTLEGSAATVRTGMDNMELYSCIHLACHGTQDAEEPLKSGFFLHDGRLELSTIAKGRLKSADLAFLSACQTSTGDLKLSEEAVHLAAGMLAAGYRGVVATMWSIQDQYAPMIAETFYNDILRRSERNGLREIDGVQAAYALHHAGQQLRMKLGNSESSFLAWIPYVHFGL